MRDLDILEKEWVNIKEFEGYEISNFGEVRSKDRLRKGKEKGVCFIKGQILKLFTNNRGYSEARFRNKGTHNRVVHRIVAKHFIPNPNNLPQVNHKDGNKQNNRVDNLEWVNNSQNQLHAYSIGLQPSKKGENNGRSKLTNDKVTELKRLYNSGLTTRQCSESLGINIHSARNIINGTTWKSNNTKIIRRDDRYKK